MDTQADALASNALRARLATCHEDVEAAARLRYAVYVAEQGKAYAQADHARAVFTDDFDAGSDVVLVEDAGQLVGTVRASSFADPRVADAFGGTFERQRFPESGDDAIVVCTRLAVLPEYRRSVARDLLFTTIYATRLAKGTELCFAACAPVLLRLFQHYGFVEYAEPYTDPTVGMLHRTVLRLRDLDTLRRAGSPFLSIALAQADAAAAGAAELAA